MNYLSILFIITSIIASCTSDSESVLNFLVSNRNLNTPSTHSLPG